MGSFISYYCFQDPIDRFTTDQLNHAISSLNSYKGSYDVDNSIKFLSRLDIRNDISNIFHKNSVSTDHKFEAKFMLKQSLEIVYLEIELRTACFTQTTYSSMDSVQILGIINCWPCEGISFQKSINK